MPTLSLRLVLRALGALLLGVVVGSVGTVLHRSTPPWGVVVCLLLVLAASVAVRASGGWVASVALLVGLFLSVQVLSGRGPGGDVLVPAGGAIGWVWAIGSLAVAVAVALAPRAWFADVPLRRRPGTP
ncbi:hypothetical protein KQI48_18585 [Cellulomonas hominis]|uniref:Putative membrane protein YccC n=1 Tax=Cellulomonas hominis TaxID=156981 RepID=A0A511F8X1_9CELL|nr:hypothetical protein [Cellulomonas hominis]MBB5471895.1 putative membrane protein YccC [Cellulomonas hominis]MBU5424684.1 hypothetical protein [Cellulomonas hominis]NKY10696.1 hypothetical protein [Cellulomonas hominis]GEL45736.1 hypothetical protein CHO01_08520 [Cellulomonas hominis]